MNAFWAVGECMLELRPGTNGGLRYAAAGDSFNTAVYLKRLQPELSVRFVSALGDDAFSGLIREQMREHGVDHELVATLPGGAPGLYAIATAPDGERRFTYWRSHSAARSMLAPPHLAMLEERLDECRALLLTGISLAILDEDRRRVLLELAQRVKDAGGLVVLDNNYRATLWDAPTAATSIARAARVCTHALVSFEDEALMHGDTDPTQTMSRLFDLGVYEAVVKLGAAGCLVAQRNGVPLHVAAPATRAVDTTAAGDSFNAGYLARRMRAAPAAEAAAAGCALAAAVVAHEGAIIPRQFMPS